MRAIQLVKKVWQDPVGSKVIAAAIVAVIALAIGPVRSWLSGALHAITSNLELAWLVLMTIGLVILWVRVSRLTERLATGFVDDFKGDLGQKWDFVGPWEIIHHELVVTGSDQGGLTRAGALWENYTLTFEAKIMNVCLGVIIRAQDLDNYYMLQVNMDRIRPHRRVAFPAIGAGTSPSAPPNSGAALPIVYQVGWQIFQDNVTPLSDKRLDQWFSVRVSVHGRALEMSIDGDKVFCERSFLHNATGSVGFRNAGAEKALVRNVRVSLDR